MISREQQLEIMRNALVDIARHSRVNGKPMLTRREMQSAARRALVESGYPSWAEPVTGKVSK